MHLEGPEEYKIAITPEAYKVECRKGTSKFSGLSCRLKMPKLYIVSVDRVPIYVGITTQRMSTRLSYGWKAVGKNGYWGYAFRRTHQVADLASAVALSRSGTVFMSISPHARASQARAARQRERRPFAVASRCDFNCG